MRPLLLLILVVPMVVPVLCAGQPASSARDTGTVTGHVYYADTNTPARMASVQLETAAEAENAAAGRPVQISGDPSGGIVETNLSGAFTLTHVPAGTYYVYVAAPGYLQEQPPQDKDAGAQTARPAKEPLVPLTKVELQADETANVDVVLRRGAAVSGAVRYDDGSPASGARVSLLHRNKKNKWVPLSDFHTVILGAIPIADDLGHYRVSGLPTGSYIVEVQISQMDLLHHGPQGFGLHTVERTALGVYSGDTPFVHDAVPFKLRDGEERTGEDITIPLSKLRTVSGVVTAAATGQPVGDAMVVLLDPYDKRVVASAETEDGGRFSIDSVPQGTYTLRVIDANDSQEREVGLGDHRSILVRSSVHRYGELEKTIAVEGDLESLVLAVPSEKGPSAQAAARHAAP